jgi:GNAT superfamily N-acetyltransferase
MARKHERIAALTPDRAPELVDLWTSGGFDESLPGEGLAAARDAEAEADWIRLALDTFGDCGRLLYADDGLIAYARYAPPELFAGRAGGVAARVRPDAILMPGLVVAPRIDGAGIAKLLLQAVEKDLHMRGFAAIEAFACAADPAGPPRACWPVEFYEGHGFKARAYGPPPAIVRLELKTIVSWTDNLEAVLDALLAAGAALSPKRAPAANGTLRNAG